MDEKWINNWVELCGTLGGRPVVSHVSRGETYYVFPLHVHRLSGTADEINILARSSLMEEVELEEVLPKITVSGEVRSFNNKSGEGNRLVITVFARKITLADSLDFNEVNLRGAICKPPNLRRTPMGREICDLMLAVSRRYGRSDYLPCIAWGQNALESAQWPVGAMIQIDGRIQSRKYIKSEDENTVEKTAFEISILKQQIIIDDV